MPETFARARRSDLEIQDALDELLIYDTRSHQAHCLGATAACVWQAADGQRSVSALADHATATLGVPCTEDVVWQTLAELRDRDLLDVAPTLPAAVSRRAAMAALTTAAALVTSVLVPTPAWAQSGVQGPQGPQGAQGAQGDPG